MDDRSVIDACVHPIVRRGEDIKAYMSDVWSKRFFPAPERYLYPHPVSDFAPGTRPEEGAPGSDRTLLEEQLFGDAGIAAAVLLPLTRGLSPDVDLGSEICRATNRWLAEEWLDPPTDRGRLLGSIRVNPHDPEAAVREIERWSEHPSFVQIAVPMEAHAPYGKRHYLPIWEAAVEAGLPVAVHTDDGAGVEFPPSPVGYFRHHIEYSSFVSFNFFYHLSSLIAEGVFDRLTDLKFVFADGGADSVMPFMWRLNDHWRAVRDEQPWVKSLPTDYLRNHARFCLSRLELPEDEEGLARWVDVNDGTNLWLYASNYPHWSYATPDAMNDPAFSEDAFERIFVQNAGELYGITSSVSV
jgi:predicted TIM-barrel fold metal-dependent hydrolase